MLPRDDILEKTQPWSGRKKIGSCQEFSRKKKMNRWSGLLGAGKLFCNVPQVL